jgi:hypothetical protein
MVLWHVLATGEDREGARNSLTQVPITNLIGDRDEVQKINVLKYWKRDMPQARLSSWLAP